MSATGTPSLPCFRMNAFCASENLDAFIAFRSSQPENQRRKTLAKNGPVCWEQIRFALHIGGNGSGLIAGGNGGETLDGRGGDDFLFGGNGADRIIGGDGNDQLSGGNGPDTFVFGSGFGHDVITDFSAADHLEFDNGLFGSFHAVENATHQIGADTVITLDANNSITLQNFDMSGLHASHFSFA